MVVHSWLFAGPREMESFKSELYVLLNTVCVEAGRNAVIHTSVIFYCSFTYSRVGIQNLASYTKTYYYGCVFIKPGERQPVAGVCLVS